MIISLIPIFNSTILTTSSSYNVLHRYPNAAMRMRVVLNISRIRQTRKPYRSLFKSRELYREYHNLLKILWTCCPSQRNFLFDTRDIHQTMLVMSDCREHIKLDQNQLSIECLSNLKLFDPTIRDFPKCDGGLLRNIADEYILSLYNCITIPNNFVSMVFISALSLLIFLR
ncbi:hypothetical protein I4U23_016259 [Adineta vaga]|nr:hypothetical protein I4U23_016259 [Adineta vaga]